MHQPKLSYLKHAKKASKIKAIETALNKTKYIYFVNNDPTTIGVRSMTIPRMGIGIGDSIAFYNKKDKYRLKRTYDIDYFMAKCNLPCLMTSDKNYLGEGNVDKFDALYFKLKQFAPDDQAKMAIQERRSPHQRYILSTFECSDKPLDFVNEKYMSNYFYNWTMNFRRDSDIINSYGPFIAKTGNIPDSTLPFSYTSNPKGILRSTRHKTKTAYWVVSRCETPIHREKFAKKLQEYMELDIYSRANCFGNGKVLNCPKKPKNFEIHNHVDPYCHEKVAKQYWFFLAFENNICNDYITEKLWRTLQTQTVPVVMGGGNYFRDAPERSYIDVNDFPTVSALADYLIHLTQNPVEYLKYFDWKKEYKLFYQNPYCTICQKLHNKNEPVKMYPNISKWYYEDNEGKKQCTDGSERDYYKSFMTEK